MLVEANLTGAELDEADLTRARLDGGNLTGAELDGADLARALGNDETVWPDGWDRMRRAAAEVDEPDEEVPPAVYPAT